MKWGGGGSGRGGGVRGDVGELTAGMMKVKGVKHKINSALSFIQAVPAQITSSAEAAEG